MDPILTGLTGTIITPSSPEYEQARQGWNRAIQKFPCVIVYCSSTEDIQNAICWARQHHVGIRIRSGGHNYQGYSNGDGVLIIDVSEMDQVTLDEDNGSVCVQGGIKNSELYNYLGSRGYPFPGGTCPTVGASGYTLGGGWGYSCRYMGLGCDNLISLEMINYEGKLLCANQQHSDLFWACRGAGGGNFGVITSMTYRLPPKIEQVTLIKWNCLNASLVSMVFFLVKWQEWLVGLDPRMTVNASLNNSEKDGLSIHVEGLFYGCAEEAEQILKPLIQDTGVLSLKETTFLEAIQEVQSESPDWEKFQATSGFVTCKYSMGEIETIVSMICQKAEGAGYAALNLYALGGKVSEVDHRCTAFYYRNAAYIMGIKTEWEDNCDAAANKNWFYQRFQILSHFTVGAYVNNPYECIRNYNEAYFGGNLGMLRRVARKYDPMNVFSFPQAIR